jgi:hypothetical protein
LKVISRGGPIPGEEPVEASVGPEIGETEENVGKVAVGIDAAPTGSYADASKRDAVARRSVFSPTFKVTERTATGQWADQSYSMRRFDSLE